MYHAEHATRCSNQAAVGRGTRWWSQPILLLAQRLLPPLGTELGLKHSLNSQQYGRVTEPRTRGHVFFHLKTNPNYLASNKALKYLLCS